MDGKLVIILLGFIYVHKYLYEIVTGALFWGAVSHQALLLSLSSSFALAT